MKTQETYDLFDEQSMTERFQEERRGWIIKDDILRKYELKLQALETVMHGVRKAFSVFEDIEKATGELSDKIEDIIEDINESRNNAQDNIERLSDMLCDRKPTNQKANKPLVLTSSYEIKSDNQQ